MHKNYFRNYFFVLESEEADDGYDEVEDVQDTPTNRAFAQMRTQNKEIESWYDINSNMIYNLYW